MRGFIALFLLLLGVTLAVLSYFFLTAPLGQPLGPAVSNPRFVGAPAVFILGIILIFLAAEAYELLPERAPAAAKAPAPSRTSEALAPMPGMEELA